MAINIQLTNKTALYGILFIVCTAVQAEDRQLSAAIQKQVASASDCETLAYDVVLKNIDADEVFKDCVESRAVLIGMQKRYGVGKYGQIDIIDKLEGYSYLSNSKNKRVRNEALSYSTAAGSE